jgi:hypothetical protein
MNSMTKKGVLDLVHVMCIVTFIQIYIYIYIDTPSACRPRYIYGFILRETIELEKNP